MTSLQFPIFFFFFYILWFDLFLYSVSKDSSLLGRGELLQLTPGIFYFSFGRSLSSVA